MMKKAYLLLLLLFLLPCAAQAQEAKDITHQSKILVQGGKKSREPMTDRKYMTSWVGKDQDEVDITIKLPEGETGGGLYICWGVRPESWTLYHDTQIAARSGGNGFAHEFVPFEGDSVRLSMRTPPGVRPSIVEMFVLSRGETPAWVQRWQPTQEKADLLVLVAHPDDELLFMGGTIPYYLHDRQKSVVVCYMTCANTMRQSEMLNGLWAMGVRHYPVIGAFPDSGAKNMEKMLAKWGGDQARAYAVELYRRFQPQVVLSHDVKGEYGHYAHMVCAQLAQYAAENAGNKEIFPESARQYGVWQASKLYLHLYPDNPIRMDWNQPLSSLGGKTPLEVAELGYAQHRSQRAQHKMGMDKNYDSSLFGLAYTLVGLDDRGNDFFENVPPRAELMK